MVYNKIGSVVAVVIKRVGLVKGLAPWRVINRFTTGEATGGTWQRAHHTSVLSDGVLAFAEIQSFFEGGMVFKKNL